MRNEKNQKMRKRKRGRKRFQLKLGVRSFEGMDFNFGKYFENDRISLSTFLVFCTSSTFSCFCVFQKIT